jgi:hypothetical protein
MGGGEWPALAAEAKGIAERMQEALARKTMLETAAGYERLASYAGLARSRANRVAPITSTDIYRSPAPG